jgi:hypothetical protein
MRDDMASAYMGIANGSVEAISPLAVINNLTGAL